MQLVYSTGPAEWADHNESCSGTQTVRRCDCKDPDDMEEACPNKTKYFNFQENYPAFSSTSNVYKRWREIMEVKFRRNIPFLKTSKIVETYMKDKTCTNVAQWVSPISNNN